MPDEGRIVTYGFAPLAAIDTVNSHAGFYIVLAIVVACLLLSRAIDDDGGPIWWIAVVLVTIAGYVSFTTGEIKTFANTQVTATLVGFEHEAYNESRTSGKSTRRVDVRNSYVVYRVGDSQITFPATHGQAYPQRAILYRN